MMAYLFLETTMEAIPEAGFTSFDLTSASASAGLTRLEWSVVAVASTDRLSTLRRPGRFGVACGYLFGRRPNAELADPRLETLRRIAVLIQHDSSLVPHAEYEAFILAGFTQAQYELLVSKIRLQHRRTTAGGKR